MYHIDFNKPVHVYFMGIGGISMSGLADILLSKGFRISGSDMKQSELTDRLISQGVPVHIGQTADNITDDIDVAVYTAAIHPDNPEFAAITEKGIPVLTRAELLGEIMSNYVGIVRSDLRLKRAWDRLDLLYEETEALFKRVKASRDICELRNMINVGYLITRQAIERKECRGLHYTTDYPLHAYDKK